MVFQATVETIFPLTPRLLLLPRLLPPRLLLPRLLLPRLLRPRLLLPSLLLLCILLLLPSLQLPLNHPRYPMAVLQRGWPVLTGLRLINLLPPRAVSKSQRRPRLHPRLVAKLHLPDLSHPPSDPPARLYGGSRRPCTRASQFLLPDISRASTR